MFNLFQTIIAEECAEMCRNLKKHKKKLHTLIFECGVYFIKNDVFTWFFDYLDASSTATATATVAPTMGLLPMPMRPIIST